MERIKSLFNYLRATLYSDMGSSANVLVDSDNYHYIALTIFVLMMVAITVWLNIKASLNRANCDAIASLNSDKPAGISSNTDNSNQLRDYYVKTAYNACASGQFKNDFMNICALKNVIKQGARCIDFQIYSVDDEPVIAASSVKDYNIKETYNSVPFRDALTLISENAFDGSTCPNPDDPIILHLRIMSNNVSMYDKMALMISEILSNKLLGPSYSYKHNAHTLGNTILKDLEAKVIIIVDKKNPLFESTNLDELVNMASSSEIMRSLRYAADVKYSPDPDELIEYNKNNMTIVMPELSISSSNHNAQLAWDYGCQFVAMSFQNLDSNMDNYNSMFSDKGRAFVLKPEILRNVTPQQTTTISATSATPSYVYEPKTVTKDFYSFTI